MITEAKFAYLTQGGRVHFRSWCKRQPVIFLSQLSIGRPCPKYGRGISKSSAKLQPLATTSLASEYLRTSNTRNIITCLVQDTQILRLCRASALVPSSSPYAIRSAHNDATLYEFPSLS